MDFETIDDIFGSDSGRSTKGAPVNIGLNKKNKPVILYVAEAGNEKHLKATRSHERALEASRHNQAKRRMINAKIIAEGLLMGWSGILDKDGNEVPATMENKVEALMHSMKMMGDVVDAAQDRANYIPDVTGADDEMIDPVEETEKN